MHGRLHDASAVTKDHKRGYCNAVKVTVKMCGTQGGDHRLSKPSDIELLLRLLDDVVAAAVISSDDV